MHHAPTSLHCRGGQQQSTFAWERYFTVVLLGGRAVSDKDKAEDQSVILKSMFDILEINTCLLFLSQPHFITSRKNEKWKQQWFLLLFHLYCYVLVYSLCFIFSVSESVNVTQRIEQSLLVFNVKTWVHHSHLYWSEVSPGGSILGLR